MLQKDADYREEIENLLLQNPEKWRRGKVCNADVFNIYVSGIDLWSVKHQFLDQMSNIIMTVNRKILSSLLTTTPRDRYVPIAGWR